MVFFILSKESFKSFCYNLFSFSYNVYLICIGQIGLFYTEYGFWLINIYLFIYLFLRRLVAVTGNNGSAAVDRVMITWFPESCHSPGMWTNAVLNRSMSSITRVGPIPTLLYYYYYYYYHHYYYTITSISSGGKMIIMIINFRFL